MPMPNAQNRRLLRAGLQPLVVTAVDPEGISALRLDPELFWAACLSEFEQVEIRALDERCWEVPILSGGAGEVEVLGALGRQLLPGDVISVLAYVYVAESAVADHQAHFVQVGEGNRAIEIACRRALSFPVHPSYVEPADTDVRAAST